MPRPLMYNDDINALRQRIRTLHDLYARTLATGEVPYDSFLRGECIAVLDIAHEMVSYFASSAHPLTFDEHCHKCKETR